MDSYVILQRFFLNTDQKFKVNAIINSFFFLIFQGLKNIPLLSPNFTNFFLFHFNLRLNIYIFMVSLSK